MRRFVFNHAWPFCKLIIMVCFWFSRITTNDMNTLLIRGADDRQKAWRLWLSSGQCAATPETSINNIAVNYCITNKSRLPGVLTPETVPNCFPIV
ncbi:MAG: hypothetical protein MUC87_13950 [Bacteroidia bacterium]|nr:hypothetical protein [Bacteroidia bacterium]